MDNNEIDNSISINFVGSYNSFDIYPQYAGYVFFLVELNHLCKDDDTYFLIRTYVRDTLARNFNISEYDITCSGVSPDGPIGIAVFFRQPNLIKSAEVQAKLLYG